MILGAALVVIVCSVFVFLWRSGDANRSPEPSPEPRTAKKVIPEPPGEQPIPELTPRQNILESRETKHSPEIKSATPVPEETAMDPEDQPRNFFVLDFMEISDLPEGYTLEDLEFTQDGIKLKPLTPGEEARPRYGVLHSPVLEMDFPSNAVSPLWRQDVTEEGTSVFIEVAVSPDGDNWGLWQPVHYDDDAGQPTEFYPDGSPNPNYGYTPGGVLCWGMSQYNYFRFRATLYSETEESPSLTGFRLFYQDSTLGKGHVAEVSEGEKKQ